MIGTVLCGMNGYDLYIIQMARTGDVKVGRSKHPEKRLKELQTGCPHPLRIILHMPGYGHMEKELHRRMAHKSLKGEWFRESALAELPDFLYERLNLLEQDWWK